MVEMTKIEVRFNMRVKGAWRLKLVSWLLRGVVISFEEVR